jgi:hypothetical protein
MRSAAPSEELEADEPEDDERLGDEASARGCIEGFDE